MLNYQIIASDLDGTLLNNQARISSENYQAIAKYVQMGGHFVPSSGRTLTEIPDLVRDIPQVRYILFSDGAGIYDKETGKYHYANMSAETTAMVLDTLAQYETVLTVRTTGVSYVDIERHDRDHYDSYRMSKGYREFIFTYSKPVTNFDAFCRSFASTEMICAFFRSDEEQAQCKKQLEETGLVTIASSEPTNLEIFSADAGKGKGLLRLAKLLGVDPSRTIGVGDSTNDLQSIQTAGLGLAMGNAWDAVKAAADQVICTNEEHMMPYLLAHIIREIE